MDSNVVFPRKLLKQFIQLYKEQSCLWDRNCLAYKNKQKRHEAISKLTQLVQEYDPSATRVHVLRKIESLRACIRREHKRVVQSRRKAKSPEEIYVPTLWYYDSFSFFYGEDEDNTSAKFGMHLPEQSVSVELSEEDEEDNTQVNEISYGQQSYSSDYSNMEEVPVSPSMSKRLPFDEDQTKAIKRQCTGIDDEYDAIGINVAAKLRALPPNMRILAEKLINDVLFQAQVNGLNSDTVITTTDPFK